MKNVFAGFFLVLFLLLGLFFSGTVFLVKETQYCVQTRLSGFYRKIDQPGIYFKIPGMDRTYFYTSKFVNVDPQPENVVTGDQKKLIVDNYVKWQIIDPEVFYRSLGTMTRAEDRVSIIATNALRDVLGKYELHEIISGKRQQLTAEATKLSSDQTKDLGVAILDISIKSVDMPKANIDKAFERMKSERNKEANYFRSKGEEESLTIRAETDKEIAILKAEAIKKSQVLRAEADAKAARLYAESYNKDPDFYSFYRSLKALETTMDTSTTLVLSPKSTLFKYLANP